jgi:hypothetical protein
VLEQARSCERRRISVAHGRQQENRVGLDPPRHKMRARLFVCPTQKRRDLVASRPEHDVSSCHFEFVRQIS